MSDNLVIGVLGGMGTYATIHLFEQYAEVFKAEKEWERPRIVIDNRCTMPSRVRAFLYKENVDQLVCEMAESLNSLKDTGCNRIILACNTSHLFLPLIYQKYPDIQSSIVHIIETCVNRIKSDGLEKVFLLGSEGTIESHIYQDALEKVGITCVVPEQSEYAMLRDCIEAVKQNKSFDVVRDTFLELVNRYDSCILGCTELPILYDAFINDVSCKNIYDPLMLAIQKLHEEYENE
ncbi:aspartate/glutamate racemase family protein [Ruminococcus flavefaciens]|uniref:Aspartate racemase n=1 Tax=Ruminococcus flavefaciens TaxID=1265 RepID=A0A1M7GA66_RUMFL|nr:amino acid racemase [Ruminococcus flavefaciens]SHM13170.1 aspartate racemase [Ruminococcus flavefaciens]